MERQESNLSPVRPERRREKLFFWLTAAVLLFAFLGRNALWASEDRWAEVVREMMLSGDYWHPAINGKVYFDKPLLSYWLILPFARLLGLTCEAACRIPSALAAFVALWAVRRLGRDLFGRACGRLAGWVLLGCYGFLSLARTASADVENMAAIVLAVTFFFAVEKKAGFWNYLLFYLIIFIGALCKGLPALVMPVAFVLPFLFLSGRWRAHLKWRNLAAFLIALAVYLVPFFVAAKLPLAEGLTAQTVNGAAAVSGLELVWKENVVRVFRPFDHKDPFYSYFYQLPRILLPWTPFFLTGLAALIAGWKKLDPRQKGLLLGMAVVFLLFTASGSRRWYYVLPLAPFCAVAAAAGLTTSFGWEKLNERLVRVYWYVLVIGGSLAAAAILTLPLGRRMLDFQLPVLIVAALPAAGLAILAAIMFGSAPDSLLREVISQKEKVSEVTFALTAAVGVAISLVLPALTVFRTEKPFFLKLKEELREIPAAHQLFLFSDADPKYLYYAELSSPVTATGPVSSAAALRTTTEFVRNNASRRVALFCTSRPRDLRHLAEIAKTLHLPLDIGHPAWREETAPTEKATARKWLVWLVDLPPAEPVPSASIIKK